MVFSGGLVTDSGEPKTTLRLAVCAGECLRDYRAQAAAVGGSSAVAGRLVGSKASPRRTDHIEKPEATGP